MGDSVEQRLREALAMGLPGEAAQFRMAPFHRRSLALSEDFSTYRPSAVMILLCEDTRGELFFPLIERMVYNGAHSGQIALPSGIWDPADADLEETARRECFEEIGIGRMEIIGKLTPLHIPVSKFMVHPFIGKCLDNPPVFEPHEREVRAVISASPEELLGEAAVETGLIRVSETVSIEAPWFSLQGKQVWGATAMILSELAEVWKRVKK